MPEHTKESIEAKVIQIVADVTENDVDDVSVDTQLQNELLIEEHDLLPIISEINTVFKIKLKANTVLAKAETVGDIIELVIDETLWG